MVTSNTATGAGRASQRAEDVVTAGRGGGPEGGDTATMERPPMTGSWSSGRAWEVSPAVRLCCVTVTVSGWGRRRRSVGGRCCSKVVVAASGPAATVQWDRLGVYVATGGEHNGRAGLKQLSVVCTSCSDDNVQQHLLLVESAYFYVDLALFAQKDQRQLHVEPGPQARVRAAE